VGLLVVITRWAALLAVGWALLYLPHVPDDMKKCWSDYRVGHGCEPRCSPC